MAPDHAAVMIPQPSARATRHAWPWLAGFGFASPALIVLLVFFLAPAAVLFSYSVMTQQQNGSIGAPFTLHHFVHMVDTPLYAHVLLVTLRISFWTSLLSLVLGFPAALVVVRGTPMAARITTIVLIAPLVVSIVVRTYGWQLLLANGNTGALNWLLHQIGFGPAAVRVMYSETAVVIASLHVYLPMMVLPLASSLARIPPSLEEAARTLGAPTWRVMWRVTLPLSLPGLMAGLSLVFTLTFSSYVTPAILGGNRAPMLGNLLEQQVVAVFDWPFASAIAVLMVVVVVVVSALATKLLDGRRRALEAA